MKGDTLKISENLGPATGYGKKSKIYANRRFLGLTLVIVVLCGCHAGSHQDIRKSSNPASLKMSKAPIQFFQEYLSGIDGDRCPMTPNCSTYCLTAIEKHGALLGYMMCADRLMRCGRDEVHIGKKIWSNRRFRTYDPVENNDFWWDQEARRPDGS